MKRAWLILTLIGSVAPAMAAEPAGDSVVFQQNGIQQTALRMK